eukprot:scaffold461_cov321-Pavlova_lutheri.AAC.8
MARFPKVEPFGFGDKPILSLFTAAGLKERNAFLLREQRDRGHLGMGQTQEPPTDLRVICNMQCTIA